MSPPSSEGLSVKFKAFGHTFNIPRRKYICKDSFSLTTCSHLRWSLRPSLPANLPPALCPSVHRLLRPDLCGWPVEPQGPLSLAQRWPPEEAQHRGERASSRWTKGECNVLAPHESSQAHREHIRTSGFYLPFLYFFCSCKESTGRQVRQVPQERHAPGPKELHVYILPIHVVGFHILRSPLKRYGKWRFIWQEPASIGGVLHTWMQPHEGNWSWKDGPPRWTQGFQACSTWEATFVRAQVEATGQEADDRIGQKRWVFLM